MRTNIAPRIPRDRLPVGPAFAAAFVISLGLWAAIGLSVPPAVRAVIHFLAWLLS